MCVSLDNLVKPGKKGAAASTISLKPQAFGIKEQLYSLDQYVETVIEGIEDSQALPTDLKAYLLALVDWFMDRGSQASYNKLWGYEVSGLPINDIEKDFGEVLGPICLLRFPEVARKKNLIVDPKSTKIFVPLRPNEPLMDYKLVTHTDGTGYLISAKTQGASNTVKPADILMLLAKDDATLKKWTKTKEYKVFDILADKRYSSVTGPAMAAFALSAAGDKLFDGFNATKAIPDLNKGMPKAGNVSAEVMAACAGFINHNDYLKKIKGGITTLQLNYEIEKVLVLWSNQNTKRLTELFLDAVSNRVKYVKFSGIGKKQPQFEIIAESQMAEQGVAFRSKSGHTRSADKLGIQT